MLESSCNPFLCLFSIVFGYLVGSFSPAYFFGRLKGVDIRQIGTGNVGTLNLLHNFGLKPAIPTALFDISKGILAILLAQSLGVNIICTQISGFAAIVGHVFPFYLRFRGGQGVATATGIMLFYLVKYVKDDITFLYTLCLLLIIVVIFSYVTKGGELVGLVVLPVLCYSMLARNPGFAYTVYLLVVVSYIIAIGVLNMVKYRLIQIRDETFSSHWWRVVLRPCAVIFVVVYLYWPQRQVLVFVGSIALLFILVDVVRFVVRQANVIFAVRIRSFLKKGESRRFTSMTMFLIAAFIVVLVFQKDIAIAALTYLIFGDIFSKIYGLGFGRHKLFDKTVEGSLAYLGGVLICAYVLYTSLGIPLLMLFVGAIAATIAEFMPVGLDDNFTVGIVSGAVMTVMRIWGQATF